MAASLGLKVAALPPKPASRPAAAPAPSSAEAPDLMGGLESPPRKVQHRWMSLGAYVAPACDAIIADSGYPTAHDTLGDTEHRITRVKNVLKSSFLKVWPQSVCRRRVRTPGTPSSSQMAGQPLLRAPHPLQLRLRQAATSGQTSAASAPQSPSLLPSPR